VTDVTPLTPDELLTTTRAVRRRLDLSRPVERALVEEAIAVASQAPSGGNFQPWTWIVVEDAATRAELARIYREAAAEYAQSMPTRMRDRADTAQSRVGDSAAYLNEHLHEVPLLIVPCLGLRTEGLPTFALASLWGSIFPAVWSCMLALRARGLGSSLTTVHLRRERAAAELLGIDADKVTQVGLLPVAHTVGDTFHPAPRRAPTVRWV
jgi:nitroreductase